MSYQELFIEKCIEAVKSNGLALWYVPEALKTPEILNSEITKESTVQKIIDQNQAIDYA